MPSRGLLDTSCCEDGDVDKQLNLAESEGNAVVSHLPDYAFDEEIKEFRRYIRECPVRRPSKIEKRIEDLQREQLFRKAKQNKIVDKEQELHISKGKNEKRIKAGPANARAEIFREATDIVPTMVLDVSFRRTEVDEEDDDSDMQLTSPPPNPHSDCLTSQAFDKEIEERFDEIIEKNKTYLYNLTVCNTREMDEAIQDLQREQLSRKRKERNQEVAAKAKSESKAAETDSAVNGGCSGRRRVGHVMNGLAISNEHANVSTSKRGGPFLQLSPNNRGSTLARGGKGKRRFHYGDLAGPSRRLGLRSSVTECNVSNKKMMPSSIMAIERGKDCGLMCGSCRKRSKNSHLPSAEEELKKKKLTTCHMEKMESQIAGEGSLQQIRREQIAAAVKRQRSRPRVVLPGITIDDGPRRERMYGGILSRAYDDISSDDSDDEF